MTSSFVTVRRTYRLDGSRVKRVSTLGYHVFVLQPFHLASLRKQIVWCGSCEIFRLKWMNDPQMLPGKNLKCTCWRQRKNLPSNASGMLKVRFTGSMKYKIVTPPISLLLHLLNTLTPNIWLFILPSSCYTFPCKLVIRIWCKINTTNSTWIFIYLNLRPDKFEHSHNVFAEKCTGILGRSCMLITIGS